MSRPVFGRAEEGARPARLDRDRGLVEAARRDPSRFDALYRKYLAQCTATPTTSYGNHHAAEDASERVFMQALAGLPRFEERVDLLSLRVRRPNAADSADVSTFRVWLFRIARQRDRQ